jgi:uncharacterized protein (DUF58 family)
VSDFLPPHLLERLGGLDLIARTVVQGFVSGTHRSPHRGSGDDFARHRPYQQGDETRYVDWKLYGRTDRLYVREFREESNLRAFLVVDSSLSMGFADGLGERAVTKARYAAYVAAALAHLMLASGDAVGLAAFGAKPRLLVPARTRRGHLHELLLHLERLRPEGSNGAAAALDQVGDALRRRGRVVLISDLLEEDGGDALTGALGRLRARGDEVIVVRVLTPTESGVRPLPAGRFYDPERPERSTAAAPASDEGYRERVDAYYDALAGRFREQGTEYLALSTADPVEHALGSWLRMRRA